MDFPGGSVVKNSPANVGDAALILGLGGFRMTWGNWTYVPQLLNPRTTIIETHVLSRAHAPQQDKPPQWDIAPAHHN